MNGIISELSLCAREYEARTGKKPTQFHLGKSELLALGRWAYARGYIDDERKVAFMDSGEPHKVMGLKINAVDEDRHMRASE